MTDACEVVVPSHVPLFRVGTLLALSFRWSDDSVRSQQGQLFTLVHIELGLKRNGSRSLVEHGRGKRWSHIGDIVAWTTDLRNMIDRAARLPSSET